MSARQPLALLALYAHPDDESFGPGGTLARYAAEGIDVHVAIVTDGAAGEADAAFLTGFPSLAARRSQELAAAGRALGVTMHELGYGDSGMEGSPANHHPDSLYQASLDEVACRLVALIRTLRPQVLLTHDPTGIYYHPDHIKVHHAVNLAWEWSGDRAFCQESGPEPWQPERLFWNVISDRWLKRMVRFLRLLRQDPSRFGRNGDIDLTRLGTADEEITTRIDVRDQLATKRAASAAHASQGGGDPLLRRLPLFIQKGFFGKEAFVQAQPAAPIQRSDLFAGLR
ncbi:MAG: PIG-L family deacetylase [Anaerolineales bacterium]|nr:PIG-L family deacetylase [Anaerolineales bacterium]MCB9126785.1 PIG-L family deacetylase [Ardenticatenales bacterium]MCB9172644.1 PIG-L family deacetylase [Ardenticatenales bacterium]